MGCEEGGTDDWVGLGFLEGSKASGDELVKRGALLRGDGSGWWRGAGREVGGELVTQGDGGGGAQQGGEGGEGLLGGLILLKSLDIQ